MNGKKTMLGIPAGAVLMLVLSTSQVALTGCTSIPGQAPDCPAGTYPVDVRTGVYLDLKQLRAGGDLQWSCAQFQGAAAVFDKITRVLRGILPGEQEVAPMSCSTQFLSQLGTQYAPSWLQEQLDASCGPDGGYATFTLSGSYAAIGELDNAVGAARAAGINVRTDW